MVDFKSTIVTKNGYHELSTTHGTRIVQNITENGGCPPYMVDFIKIVFDVVNYATDLQIMVDF